VLRKSYPTRVTSIFYMEYYGVPPRILAKVAIFVSVMSRFGAALALMPGNIGAEVAQSQIGVAAWAGDVSRASQAAAAVSRDSAILAEQLRVLDGNFNAVASQGAAGQQLPQQGQQQDLFQGQQQYWSQQAAQAAQYQPWAQQDVQQWQQAQQVQPPQPQAQLLAHQLSPASYPVFEPAGLQLPQISQIQWPHEMPSSAINDVLMEVAGGILANALPNAAVALQFFNDTNSEEPPGAKNGSPDLKTARVTKSGTPGSQNGARQSLMVLLPTLVVGLAGIVQL